ncbi:hypothetical protein WR25_25789 [Diploscapter pachys]|uniref:Uncharacterized protein n=1 Tax=Diploscapter pachys TaxID=2018661 RepID=A0A2A2JGV1_9BILA|nr:hypothetical protein WR25_25789 [Diploscapter pachys]
MMYIANGSYMTAFFTCTDEWVLPDDSGVKFNDHCDRVLFFQDKTFLGSLGDLRDAGTSVLTNKFPTNIDFNQYRATRKRLETLTMPSNGANFAVNVHFVTNIQTYSSTGMNLYSVNLTKNAILYVYEGIAEIDGKNFPTENLTQTIKISGQFSDIRLFNSVYTFVAWNGNVTYLLTYANGINLVSAFARALKDTLTKINQLMYYYDKELLPTTTPKIRSLFKIIEEMMRNPIEFFEMTSQEQNGKLMSHLENMQVNDVFNFNNIMSKLLMKAHELGLGDFNEHLNRLMDMNHETHQQFN